jgi:hypothetical protein
LQTVPGGGAAMTRTRYYRVWYVLAMIDGGTGNSQTRRLLGPFYSMRAAAMMIGPARVLALSTGDERYKRAAFVTDEQRFPFGQDAPPGRLDVTIAGDDYVAAVINASSVK